MAARSGQEKSRQRRRIKRQENGRGEQRKASRREAQGVDGWSAGAGDHGVPIICRMRMAVAMLATKARQQTRR